MMKLMSGAGLTACAASAGNGGTNGGGAASPSQAKVSFAALDAAIDADVARGEAPGVVLLVEHAGQTHVHVTGTMAVGSSKPMQRDTIFRIASITKPIFAVVALSLAEQEIIRLDAPIETWLPELAQRRVLRRVDGPLDDTVPAKRSITVRDLLTFQMGFGILWGPPDATPIQREVKRLELAAYGPPAPATMPPYDEWIRRFATLPLMNQPGEVWRYNTGMEILSVLLARAAKKPLADLLRERVTEPLGMKDTGFFAPPEKIDRLATAYVANAQGGIDLDEARDKAYAKPPQFASAAAGLVSTVDDLLAFAHMLRRGGKYDGGRVLREDTVVAMIEDSVSEDVKARSQDSLAPGFFEDHSWGMGIALTTKRAAGTEGPAGFGWDGGAGTSWWTSLQDDLTGILLTQRSAYPPMSALYRDFWKNAYAAIGK